ncbi:non-hydrolyzing UDP-N-acetylglucosamine 2-epimerase [Sediminibacterium sp.]|uniref:non-hydrolyzing UDP-N-acetylglucosamine 2-epimerase n=1 Tax=Sediminibacterium sp. TaxID=1917865 RepID=UPI0027354515|nr:UDP-N-acetylglucosamine 2-epimerase (non-hydrolyzing) [Sediminibacterium sp.]MDP3392417.1 UDP-N-acetylglucosamine 2-epimerase (non-hydrolyzing) [Sediminibacterium sp.]MDP3565683.1 UDP-N-acetylglucosamine 2-epimerase (non-hydrolyzing) [Sediminibacterium sp.]
MKITIIAGARPNFMKIAPIIEAINTARSKGNNISYRLVHTGQHYDKNMSDSFFAQLGIPQPDVNLESGGGSQAEQTANIMIRFEKELIQNPADLVLVVGDVTSTMACSIVAKKLVTRVAHVEAGIRSGDISMPEEVNRVVTDALADYFFTTSEIANDNLQKSGIDSKRIFFVGNTMIDTLLKNEKRFIPPLIWEEASLKMKNYFVLTLHRPANVDDGLNLKELMNEIITSAQGLPIIFPVHPRTAKNLKEVGIAASNLYLVDPLSYLEFNYLVKNAKAVITDSGGITEETTVMGVPCITLRDNTERPETVRIGTNELIGTNPKNIRPAIDRVFLGTWKKGGIPEFWDGKAAERIISSLITLKSSIQ